MIIKRNFYGNDVEIELTDEEIYRAYLRQDRKFHAEDVRCRWQEMYGDDDHPFPYDDKTAEAIAERADNIMSKNDGYWDYYWYCFEAAIKEFEEED